MKYCEIIIGPPGSGKSTYVDKKTEFFKNRNLFVINLDPGNINSGHYDYSITDKYNVTYYQKRFTKGPNASTKDILEDFVSELNQFYYDKLDYNDSYLIIDLPGQVEFFINGNSLHRLIKFFNLKGYSVVVVCLIDLVFFNHSLQSSYLFTYICVSLLEVPYVCVISKCDNYHKIDFKYDLEKVSNLEILSDRQDDPFKGFLSTKGKRFTQSLIDFLTDNPLFGYKILDYENENTVKLLQLTIDECSGYIYDEDNMNQLDDQSLSLVGIFDRYK